MDDPALKLKGKDTALLQCSGYGPEECNVGLPGHYLVLIVPCRRCSISWMPTPQEPQRFVSCFADH